MLRNRPHLPIWATLSGDLAALAAAFGAACALDPAPASGRLLGLFAASYLLSHFLSGLHSSLRVLSVAHVLLRVVTAWLRTVLTVGAFYLLWPEQLPRAAILLLALCFLPALTIVRLLAMQLRHIVRSRGRNLRFVVIAGTGPAARETAATIAANPSWGLRVLGHLHADDGPRRPGELGAPLLGHYRDLPELVKQHVIDELVVAAPRTRVEVVEELVAMARTIGLRAHVLADFVQGTWRSVQAIDLAGHLLLTLTPFPDDHVRLYLKRAMDVAVAVAGLLLLAPLFFAIAVAIKVSSRGPVFFSQPRAGLNGRLFRFWKFRTMLPDAEALRMQLLARNEMNGPVFKVRDDPRITPVGRFLRRFSLDELPQLWNVLKGDMSLVGPRPLMPHEVAGYETWQRRRMSMRPGLTCLWQVSGRNDIDFERWMRLDLEYIDKWSLAMDLRIIARTLPAVMSGRGAS